jgi:uroporphyrinogen III methyltransferase/synthase
MEQKQSLQGRVILVGAGPGDPELITVRGLTELRKCDMVVYDHLVSAELLKEIPPHAEAVYVGKKAGKHIKSQEEINAFLLENARQGKTVVRLKGGDPFIFGRGGEECLYLREHGIPYEVVPGVSAMSAVPTYAGIPLTHRDVSSSFVVVTGHENPEKGDLQIDWKTVAEMGGTLVIFMGVLNLPSIAAQLIRYGRSPETPVAVIRWGTIAEQLTIEGTLGTIVQQIQEQNLRPPGLVVIGEVVALRGKLQWFETVLKQKENPKLV